jgi:hypothetical protein
VGYWSFPKKACEVIQFASFFVFYRAERILLSSEKVTTAASCCNLLLVTTAQLWNMCDCWATVVLWEKSVEKTALVLTAFAVRWGCAAMLLVLLLLRVLLVRVTVLACCWVDDVATGCLLALLAIAELCS